MPTWDDILKEGIKRRRRQLLISLPIILLPLILAIISISHPQSFYNLLHNKKSDNEEPIVLGLDFKGGIRIIYESADDQWKTEADILALLEKSKKILTDRLSGFGNFEPSIRIVKNRNQIVIELPGVFDFENISELIGHTGTLEIYSLRRKDVTKSALLGKHVPASLLDEIIMTKEDLKDVSIRLIPNRQVQLEINDKTINAVFDKLSKHAGGTVAVMISGIAYDVIGISDNFSNRQDGSKLVITSGSKKGFSVEEAEKIKQILNWDVLPINLRMTERVRIGPVLSKEKLYIGGFALIFGTVLIFILMLFFYGTYLGIVGCVALIYCGTLILGIFKATGLVLNLPGLAGLILTAGISVDSFILIFE